MKRSLLDWLTLGIILLIADIFGPLHLLAQDNDVDQTNTDQQFVQGLRDRSLLDLADRFCEQRLKAKELPPIERANLVIEQLRTQMIRATLTGGDQRLPAWDRIAQLVQTFAVAAPEHPRLPLVKIQGALAQLAEGRLIAAELKIGVADAHARERGLDRLRQARKTLEEVERDLKKRLPQATNKPNSSGELTNDQLHSVLANLHYQLAIANLESANFYPADDQRNRLDVLTSVVDWLNETIRQLDPEQPLAHSSQIRRVEALRMMGSYPEAFEALDRVPVPDLNAANRESYWEQVLDLATESGRLTAATEVFTSAIRANPRKGPTSLALLRWALAMQRESQGAEREKWLQTSTQLLQEIDATQGPYWSRLAERTLVAATGQTVGPTHTEGQANPSQMASLDVVVRVGDAALRESRWDDALNAFEQAATSAVEMGNWQVAYESQLKVALAQEQTRAYDRASNGLVALIRRQPTHELAPIAHLRAIWDVAQAAATDPDKLNTYHDLLLEHLRDWPGRETSNQARLWLARLQVSQKELSLATENYLQIAPDSPQAPEALSDLRLVIPDLLANLEPLEQQRRMGERIARSLHTRLPKIDDPNVTLSDLDVRGLLVLAPLAAQFNAVEPTTMTSYLERSLLRNNEHSNLLAAATLGYLAEQENQQGRAGDLFQKIQDDREAIRYLFDLLIKRNLNQALATQWQARTLERLESLAETDSERLSWRLEQSRILVRNRQFELAQPLLSDLARQLPDRGDVQWLLAACLTEIPSRQTEALSQWRKIAARSRDQSDEWFEAKWHVAELLLKTGEKAQAAEMLRYLNAVPPGWSKSKLKNQFDLLFQDSTKD